MPAVEDADARVAEDVEHPPQPGGDRAARVVVGDDVARVVEPERREAARRRRPGTGSGWRPDPRCRRGPVDVDEDRAGQVRRRVVAAALARVGEPPADVGDAQAGVVEAGEEVLGA